MKRIICLALVLMTVSPVIWADIKTRKEGKVLVVDFYIPRDSTALFESDSLMSWSFIEKDLQEVLDIASQQKCNAILLRDKKDEYFKIVKGKEYLTMDYLKGIIDEMSHTTFVPGKVIGHEKVRASGAKYRQETYLNGKLHDTYESDWTSGWFAPKTSTYRSGGDTYVTQTFYVPPADKIIEKREPGKEVKIEGYIVFAEDVYRRE